MCVHVKMCSVVCSCCLQRGHSGDGFISGSILCLYVFSMGDLPERSCDNVRRVLRGRVSSSGFIVGGIPWMILLFVLALRYS